MRRARLDPIRKPYARATGVRFRSDSDRSNPGEFVRGGIAEQTEQVLRNLTAVFEAAGVGMNQVIKTTVLLADMEDFTAMNEVHGRYFREQPLARATV